MSTIFLAFTFGQEVIPADLNKAKTSVGKRLKTLAVDDNFIKFLLFMFSKLK